MAISTTAGTLPKGQEGAQSDWLVIGASSLGTIFEWYDFYLYGLLATIISAQFFSGVNETTGYIYALAAFAAGFAVRPFGALVFGRLGDLVGRKHTFLITMSIMGGATFLVGLLPSYAKIGVTAPILLVVLRLLQGLALGGEYGGAATYVAEHAPQGKRGLFTSWIQTTATLGLFLSLAVIWTCRVSLSADAFKSWGWRIPFLLSVILLGISIYIRLKLQESPLFTEMKSQGKGSKAPLRDSFLTMPNAKFVFLALFGATAGQGVVWYTGQFYALFFLQNALSLKDFTTLYALVGTALLIGTPFFVFFGWLSDRIGRKGIIMAGCLLAALTYFPLFHQLTNCVNPALAGALKSAPIVVSGADGPDLEKVKLDLNTRGYSFSVKPPEGGSGLSVAIGATQVQGYDAKALGAALGAAGYPKVADPAKINFPGAIVVLVVMIIYVTMVYGPIAAFL